VTDAAILSEKIDKFVLYDDNSAIVESMHGTFYELRHFTLRGEITAPWCSCPALLHGRVCRHRRKLTARLLAPERVDEAWPGSEIAADGGGMDMTTERECPECKEFIADGWIYCRRSPEGNSGYLHLFVCGCADWWARGDRR